MYLKIQPRLQILDSSDGRKTSMSHHLPCCYKFFHLQQSGNLTVCFLSFLSSRRSAPAAGGAPAPEGGNQPPNLTSNRRLQQTQAQVDEVSPHSWFIR